MNEALEAFLSDFLSDFKQQAPLPSCFVVAYSGGLDSTVLLHALHAKGLPVHVVHVNHQLQAASSDWEKHCKRQCEILDVPLTILRVDVRQEGLGIEAQARVARYRAIFGWMKSNSHQVLLCAHHLDDQLETVLLQLLRGSGLRGVGGMRKLGPVGVDRHVYPDFLLGRPLLAYTKANLLAYANQHALEHVNDPSNSDTTLRRNWVRHELLPSLEAHFPQSPQALLQLAGHFQAHYSDQDAQLETWLPHVLSPTGALLLLPWRELEEHVQMNILRYWLLEQGVRCGKLKLLELARQLRINKGGIRDVQKGWQIRVSRQQAILQHNES